MSHHKLVGSGLCCIAGGITGVYYPPSTILLVLLAIIGAVIATTEKCNESNPQ